MNNITGFFEKDGKFYAIKDGTEIIEEISLSELESLRIYNPVRGVYNHGVSGENVFPFNYGPSTGGMIETVDFKIYTYGERILSLDIITDFKNRNMKITGHPYQEAILIMERFNGFHSFSYSTLLSREIEQKLSMQVDRETVKTRVILLEIERIISHIFKTARLCEAASQNIASYWLFALRERLMRTVAQETGHRYMFGINTVGGLRRKIDCKKIIEVAGNVVSEYKAIINGLTVSRIFIDRIENTCKVDGQFQRGPALRATGTSFDYRQFDPYYSSLYFKPVSETGGDSLSRFLVFSSEVFQSLEIIEKASKGDIGEYKATNSNQMRSGGIETPSGDARIALEIGDGEITFLYLRTPSMLNMEAYAEGIRGNVKTDIPFAYESFGLWICEMGCIK